ncbi:proline--tRNA ligase [Candidatus Woesearchaeota archaeon]|nr:proline--tRNA ligase [Candidatus Woesearchaeota archaeon]
MEKEKNEKNKKLPKKEEINEWYPEVLRKAEIMDYGPVSGCMIIKPYGYAIWEHIQKYFDERIKKLGVKNAYFPLLIPESLFSKESEHVEGFAPEVAWVTHGGGTKLGERLAIRPTSETIMYEAYSRWIRSWRDLPLKINQWVNIVRWEFKHPTPFLRSREFLWQEGHTAFATKKEAVEEVFQILEEYRRVYEELLAVPVIKGLKSEKEKFAGAVFTSSVEAWLPINRFSQAATSHHLGQNFSKPFEIYFYDKNEEKQYVWQNSWGLSTRSIGITLMIHGDDYGLVIPPRIAPIKIVIIPIYNAKNKEDVLKYAQEIREMINKLVRDDEVVLDDSNDTPGAKYYYWELRGVPIRIEIGQRELKDKSVVIFRRDKREKENVSIKELSKRIQELFEDIHKYLYDKALKELREVIIPVESLDELKKVIEEKKAGIAYWCGSVEEEENIKYVTSGAKSVNNPLEGELERLGIKKPKEKKCFICGKKTDKIFIFSKCI